MRRRRHITLSGGRRTVSVRRSRSPKRSVPPGRGWFPWAWGNAGSRRRRANIPAVWPWDKAFWRR